MKMQESVTTGLGILKSIYDIKVLKRRIPLYCEWEVTSCCNMSCDFCSTRTSNTVLLEDTSTDEALNIIEQLSGLGTKIIHFSGGEPTLRKDLPELVSKAKEKNMIVSITTNGSAPLQRIEKLLHVDLIRVSIDGPEQFHDSMRKTPGAFKKAVEVLRFLRDRNKKPLITVVYTKDTSYKMLEELVNIARLLNIQISLNILSRNFNIENPDVVLHQKNTYLNPTFFHEYVSTISRLKKDYGNVIANPNPYLAVIQEGGLEIYGCRAMDIAICIKSDGSISLPCNGLPLKLAKGNIKEIYYGKKAADLRPLQGKHPLCKGCTIRCMASASALLKSKGFIAIFDAYIRNMG